MSFPHCRSRPRSPRAGIARASGASGPGGTPTTAKGGAAPGTTPMSATGTPSRGSPTSCLSASATCLPSALSVWTSASVSAPKRCFRTRSSPGGTPPGGHRRTSWISALRGDSSSEYMSYSGVLITHLAPWTGANNSRSCHSCSTTLYFTNTREPASIRSSKTGSIHCSTVSR
eukprot:3912527-Amphidinium_carterae.1